MHKEKHIYEQSPVLPLWLFFLWFTEEGCDSQGPSQSRGLSTNLLRSSPLRGMVAVEDQPWTNSAGI